MSAAPNVTPGGSGLRWRPLLGLVAVAAVFWIGYAAVRPTNFGGADEWLLIDLSSRGNLDFPYANRPLVLLWTTIAAQAWPNELRSYWLFNGLYLCGAAFLTVLLTRRLLPGAGLLALLAGVFAAVWAPLDGLRLSGVLSCGYSGFTLCTMAALMLFLESWHRRRLDLLFLGAVLGFVAARGVESVIPILLVAPLLVVPEAVADRRRAFKWLAVWLGVVALEVALALRPLVAGSPSYQKGALGLDPAPLRVVGRLLQLLEMQATPLVTTALSELVTPAVPLAVAAFVVLGWMAIAWRRGLPAVPSARAAALRAAGVGLTLAAAGHAGLALSRSISTPARTQILSGPGFGLALAGVVVLMSSLLPGRLARAGGLALGAWVVAVGTGRTVAMQGEWDSFRSVYAEQHRSLSDLVRRAPGLEPGTLVVLLDGGRIWPMSFTFRHAVAHLYPGQAAGLVPHGADMLYPWSFTPEGVVITPWATIRDAWDAEPSFHPWSTLVVARASEWGGLEIVDEWPEGELPPLPPGALYAPLERVERDKPPPASRWILRAGGDGR